MNRTRLGATAKPVVAFLILLAVWWVATTFQMVSKAFLPSPASVGSALVEGISSGKFIENLVLSVGRLLVAYVVGSILGVVVGVLMGLVPSVGRFFNPLLSFFSSLSGIAWVPLAIAWFGFGENTITFLIVNAVFFVVALSAMTGVISVPRAYENALLTLGANKWHLVTQVLLPGAMPSIFTGLRVGAGFAWRSLIAAEMVMASAGMGFMVFKAGYDFRQDILMAGVIVIGFVALALDHLVFEPLERRTIDRWGLV